jgi:putative endonuclease
MTADKTYQVYVIQNLAGKFYIGLSEDVRVRLQQHNEGVSTWTRSHRPWTLVWMSELLSLTEARKLETLLNDKRAEWGFKNSQD